ncbi:MAG: S1 RNA-binding domain-containing protein, partial [Patescibacteria group bacterium]
EVIIVDDGSKDDTSRVAIQCNVPDPISLKIIRYEYHRGKGHAVRMGIADSKGDFVMFMDSGNNVPLYYITTGLNLIKSGKCHIAMGLVIDNDKKFVILTDIVGLEDGNGDMDFKVAGTKDGITALQLDVKTLKLTPTILKEALAQAKEAREKILGVMNKALPEPRKKTSMYAPKIKVIKVPQDKIGEVIGPGGKMIRKIIAETDSQVDVEDDGTVNISSTTEEGLNSAIAMIEGLTKEAQPGEIYDGEVKRIQPFGAFVEILPGKDGLVHVSDMSENFVKDPNEVVSIGDKVKVRVKEIDDLGRINLSMLLDGDKDKKPTKRRSFNREGRNFDRRRPSSEKRTKGKSSGPHFPASRYLENKKKNF